VEQLKLRLGEPDYFTDADGLSEAPPTEQIPQCNWWLTLVRAWSWRGWPWWRFRECSVGWATWWWCRLWSNRGTGLL